MGDHYCCRKCLQHYDFCKCYSEKPTPTPPPQKSTLELFFGGPSSDGGDVTPDADDIRYFHDKFQLRKDVRAAKQLIAALEAFIESKG